MEKNDMTFYQYDQYGNGKNLCMEDLYFYIYILMYKVHTECSLSISYFLRKALFWMFDVVLNPSMYN